MPRFEEKYCNHEMCCTTFVHSIIQQSFCRWMGEESSTRASSCTPDVSFEAAELRIDYLIEDG